MKICYKLKKDFSTNGVFQSIKARTKFFDE